MAEDIRCLTFPMLIQLEMLIQDVPTKYGQQMLQIIGQNKTLEEVIRLADEEKKQAKTQVASKKKSPPPVSNATA